MSNQEKKQKSIINDLLNNIDTVQENIKLIREECKKHHIYDIKIEYFNEQFFAVKCDKFIFHAHYGLLSTKDSNNYITDLILNAIEFNEKIC